MSSSAMTSPKHLLVAALLAVCLQHVTSKPTELSTLLITSLSAQNNHHQLEEAIVNVKDIYNVRVQPHSVSNIADALTEEERAAGLDPDRDDDEDDEIDENLPEVKALRLKLDKEAEAWAAVIKDYSFIKVTQKIEGAEHIVVFENVNGGGFKVTKADNDDATTLRPDAETYVELRDKKGNVKPTNEFYEVELVKQKSDIMLTFRPKSEDHIDTPKCVD